jgi:hypothetical protein
VYPPAAYADGSYWPVLLPLQRTRCHGAAPRNGAVISAPCLCVADERDVDSLFTCCCHAPTAPRAAAAEARRVGAGETEPTQRCVVLYSHKLA